MSVGYAGANFALITVALLLPALVGADASMVLFVSAAIIGMQAAQSSTIQVGRAVGRAGRTSTLLLGAGSLLAGGAASLLASMPILTSVFATASGALLGILFGRSTLKILETGGAARYQRLLAVRSLSVAGLTAITALLSLPLGSLAMVLFAVGLALICALPSNKSDELVAEPTMRVVQPVWIVVFGLLGSLFYRNDVSWVRAAVAGQDDFILWHYALTFHGAIQGVVGFLVVQIVFAHRDQWFARGRSLGAKWGISGLITWLVVGSFCLYFAFSSSVLGAVAIAATLSAIVGVLSGISHASQLSWAPYTAGIVGTAGIVAVLAIDGRPEVAFVSGSVITGTVILLSVAIVGRVKWSRS